MKKSIKPIVIGNWKMNPQTLSLGTKLAKELCSKLSRDLLRKVDVVIAPPFVYLDGVKKQRGSKKTFFIGAQTTHHAKLGAHTGEVSLPMLKNLSVTHVIVGHSERRAIGENDEMINQKLIATVKSGLTGIVCVGESKRDSAGHYLALIDKQIRKAFAGIPRTKLSQTVIAYEPLWAISKGKANHKAATSDDIHEMKIFIEKVVSDVYGRNMAQKVRIIYGGSVNGRNAKELHSEGIMDGFLVGGASLRADDFIEIVKAVKKG